jgi:capsular exopolysaccharide synthesis family protein
MEDLRTRAYESQNKLALLQKQRGLIGVDESNNIITDKLKGLDEQLTEAESDRIVKEARYRIAASGNPELIATTVPEPTLQTLRAQQAQLRVDYARINTKFGEGYPKVAELASELAQVENAINGEVKNLAQRYRNDYLAAQASENMLRASFHKQEQKAYDLNQVAAQYAILKHEVEASQQLYETLQLKLQQAGVVAGLASANIAVVEEAQVPSEPVDPKPLLDLALGCGAGLFVGAFSAMAMKALDTTLQSSEQAEALTGLPTLAVVPWIRPGAKLKGLSGEAPFDAAVWPLLACSSPQSQAAESFHTLRTSLLLCSSHVPPKVLVVTSSLASEGKTFTAVNCATVLARQQVKVLLVDADLREPAIHQAFHIPPGTGLSDILQGTCTEEVAIARPESLPHLAVLPAGALPDSPAELLSSRQMSGLIASWRSHYDYVVIDTPPVSLVTDAVVLGALSDAVLLVARAGKTSRNLLCQSHGLLQRANANVAGIVLNGVDPPFPNGYHRSAADSLWHYFSAKRNSA